MCVEPAVAGTESNTSQLYRLRVRNTFIPPTPGDLSRQCFSESPLSGEYFGKLIATGEWGVCLLSSFKVRYPQNKNIFQKSSKVKVLSLHIKDMMFFGVTVHAID